MSKKRLMFAVIFSLVTLFLLAMVSASFELGNISSDIGEAYGPEENIRGWINISLDNEPSNSLISSNFEGSISLIDFLDLNLADYSCTPEYCEDDYGISNGQTSKSLSLNPGEEKILGFSLTGQIDQINSLSFDISVTNQPSCINPLQIDIFNDNSIEWKATNMTDIFDCAYGEGKGCFNESSNIEEVRVGNNTYCEKINLTESNKFKLGVWIRGNTSTSFNSSLLSMELYDLDGVFLKSCNIIQEPDLAGGEVSCEVEYENNRLQSYYVCLRGRKDTFYRIKREDEDVCGFYGAPPQNFRYDYYVFARGARFGNIGSFVLNQQQYEEQGNSDNLGEAIDNYIDYRYNKDCTNDCVIPVKFSAKKDLSVDISNILLNYTKEGSPFEERNIYDATIEPAKISSDFLILDLIYTNITVPEDYGEDEFILYLDNEEILREDIIIESRPVIKTLTPRNVMVGIDTTFRVEVESEKNITSYRWDFGDGVVENTTTNSMRHIYLSSGVYYLYVEVEDEDGNIVGKEFSIRAGSIEEAINSTLEKYKENLGNLSAKINSLPWYKNMIKEILDIDYLNSEVNRLEGEYKAALTDEELEDIILELIDLNVPDALRVSAGGTLGLLVHPEDISPEYLENMGAGQYEINNIQGYQNAIATYSNNMYMKADFSVLSLYYGKRADPILTVYKLKIIPSSTSQDELFLIIHELCEFKEQDDIHEFDDATGLTFQTTETREVEFVVNGQVLPQNLIIYTSPKFSKLEIEAEISPCNFNGVCEKEYGEDWRNCRADCKPWGTVSILLVVLFLVALIAYILLQWWYKKKYEGRLFKNKNDIYNILNFISNARSQGMKDKEIKLRLKKAGWSSEQIDYAFKKIEGKAIMPFDFLKLFKGFRLPIKKKKVVGGVAPKTGMRKL